MLNSRNARLEKATQSKHLVAVLQEDRQAMWAMYCKIAEMKPVFANSKKVRPVLSRFSQLLIDYISLGHFCIYEQLLAEKQQKAILSYANQLYPEFSSTTQSAMLFNDAYKRDNRNLNPDNLASDLSSLGEDLAKRMELEDRLCSMLLH